MSVLGLALVVMAAMLHASWNLVSKTVASGGAIFVFFYRLWSCLLYTPWVAYILFVEGVDWNWAVVLCLFLSGLLHLIYSLMLMKGYQVADLTIVYPVARGTGPLLASAVAIAWLGEPIYTSKAMGILGIVGGILLIASKGPLRHFWQSTSLTGIRWGVFIGVFIASYSLIDAWGVKELLIAPVLLNWASTLGGAFLLVPHIWSNKSLVKPTMQGKWNKSLFVGFASPMAYILVLYALQLGAGVSQVAPLREMSLVMATLAGAWFLKENVSLKRWFGCVLILIGVVLISIS